MYLMQHSSEALSVLLYHGPGSRSPDSLQEVFSLHPLACSQLSSWGYSKPLIDPHCTRYFCSFLQTRSPPCSTLHRSQEDDIGLLTRLSSPWLPLYAFLPGQRIKKIAMGSIVRVGCACFSNSPGRLPTDFILVEEPSPTAVTYQCSGNFFFPRPLQA